MKKQLLAITILAILALTASTGQAFRFKWPQMRVERPPEISWDIILRGADYIGDEACAQCHRELMEPFRKTIHSRLSSHEIPDNFRVGCESCHGPGTLHQQTRDRRRIAYYTRLSDTEKAERSRICLSCHAGKPTQAWFGSGHPRNNIQCMDCHNPHKPEIKPLLLMKEPDLCFGCHREKIAEASFPSHHPLNEGRIKCTDCHDQHGSPTRAMLKGETVNELCYKCHIEKRGPFVFEHQPVTEDCTICHSPHGATANTMLVQNQPFLCLQCHPAHIRCQ